MTAIEVSSGGAPLRARRPRRPAAACCCCCCCCPLLTPPPPPLLPVRAQRGAAERGMDVEDGSPHALVRHPTWYWRSTRDIIEIQGAEVTEIHLHLLQVRHPAGAAAEAGGWAAGGGGVPAEGGSEQPRGGGAQLRWAVPVANQPLRQEGGVVRTCAPGPLCCLCTPPVLPAPRGQSRCLNDVPCPPFTSHGASIMLQ
eukprot:COSAG01_NODE_12081_length_1804_cov_1.245161_1_plen_198_part_00